MREGSYRVANPRRGGGYSVQQVSEIPMVVGGRTPLVEGDHNFGNHVFGYASRFGRCRQKREEVTQRHRELAPTRISERYTWDRIVDEYEALFVDVTVARAARLDVARR